MKKLFVMIALCAMATSLMAAKFTDESFKNGELTVPVVYTGMLKINGWGDEGLCYNWQQTRNSYPLFLGLCQPCLDCVPCDIDMRHLAPRMQFGTNDYWDIANADPDGRYIKDQNTGLTNVDETEAFFNRARLYLVNDIDTSARKATVKVIDLIDAYWGKDRQSATSVLFQFFNTVDSVRRATTNGLYGRIGAMYQFPIYSRDFAGTPVVTGRPLAEMSNVRLNEYNRDGAAPGHTNTHTANAGATIPPCANNRTEDGVGLAALIGVKDYKAFFKIDNKAYPIVTVKAFTGDFFAWQYNYTDNNWTDNALPQYVCRKGEEYVLYKGVSEPVPSEDPHYDGKGTWYATGNITLRRNDAVTKRMMNDLNQNATSISCIPCGRAQEVKVCREYLDTGVVGYLINRQFNGWTLTYIVDLDNDGIYGETADCGNYANQWARNEVVVVAPTDAGTDVNPYLRSFLVNTNDNNDAESWTVDENGYPLYQNLYGLAPESAELADELIYDETTGDVVIDPETGLPAVKDNAGQSAGRILEKAAHPAAAHDIEKKTVIK